MARFNGAKFRELMDEKGLSERDVSMHIGYSQPMVHFFISGQRTPDIRQAASMAQLVGVKIDDLIITE